MLGIFDVSYERGDLTGGHGPRLAGALAVLSLAVAGCLPRGDAPAGRQIVADRGAFLLSLVPANGDGVLRALFFRPGKDDKHVDLWVAAVDPNGGATSELKLSSDFDSDIEVSYKPDVGYHTGLPADSRGRLLLSRALGADQAQSGLLRVDPVTGETLDLGPGDNASPSPSGQRLLISTFSAAGNYALFDDSDGSRTPLDSMRASFVGETLFYLTTAGDLMRFPPGGTAQPVATGVDNFQLATDSFRVTNGHLIVLTRAVPDQSMPDPTFAGQPPMAVTASLFDTNTLAETPLPDGPLYQYGVHFSPDTRWLTVSEPATDPTGYIGNTALIDTQNGTVEDLAPIFSPYAGWRPGRDEIWASPYGPDPSGAVSASSIYIKRPGQPVVTVPGLYFSGFTEDGDYWFSRGASFNALNSSDLIGSADDLTGPRYPAVPNGSSMEYQWTVEGGRVLTMAEVGPDSFREYFVNLIDPRTGDARLLGERGYVAAVGQTHVLGLYHYNFQRGDLTDSDFASGQSTVLAPEFAVSAIAEPQGADPYPSGARVVYQFQARFESPWDGLWLTTVP